MAEFTDADVGLAPPQARPAGPVEFSDADLGLAPAPAAASPIAAAFAGSAGAPAMEPQFDPNFPKATLGDRFVSNLKEGFDSTLAGEMVNRVQSGQVAQTAADEMARAILEARMKGSEVGLDNYASGKPSPYGQMPLSQIEALFQPTFDEAQKRRVGFEAEQAGERAALDQINPWYAEPTLVGKAIAGATALGGQVVGGGASPENFIGGFGGNVVREGGESLLRYGARRVAPGMAEGAVGGGAADPVVQSGKVERGEQEGYQPLQTLESVTLGAAVGGSFRMSGMLWDAFRASRAKAGAPDVPPERMTPDDVLNQIQVDPEFAALARANGVDPFGDDPSLPKLQERLAKRRIEESLRPNPESNPPTAAEWGTAKRPGPAQKEIARRQEEIANLGSVEQTVTERSGQPISGTEYGPQNPDIVRRAQTARATDEGTINPAATNVVPRLPDERPILVDPQGGAFRADDAAGQGRQKAEILGGASQRALPAPGRAVPTDEEIARQRAAAEGGNQPTVETPPRLMGGENRLPQDAAGVEGQRQAGEAFTLAERQRQRAAPDVADTQVAGRPEGRGEQKVYLDDDFPVEIINRKMVPDANGRSVEVATVRRYDPRTGQAASDAIEYDVPVRQLKTSQYAPEPRRAQDFETRAEVGRGPAGRIDEAQGLPRQTYRTTEPDPNPAESGRWSRPEQPDGPAPGRPWSSYEEAMRDFADRQSRGQTQPPPGGPDYSKAKASNQARGMDRDGRFVVDENGHVMSSAEGPIRFADQKQAAKWILNVGQKQSPDQIFEIAVHPSGKGFTARERGRSEPPPRGGNGPEAGPRPDAPQQPQQPAGPPPRLEGPRMEAASAASAPLPPAIVTSQKISTPLTVRVAGRDYPVSSPREASQKVSAVIDQMGIGNSKYPGATLHRGNEQIGYVAYNGRVFEGRSEEWKPGTRTLYDPDTPAATEARLGADQPSLARSEPPPAPKAEPTFEQRVAERMNDVLDREREAGPKRKDGTADRRSRWFKDSYGNHNALQEMARYDLMLEDNAAHIQRYRDNNQADFSEQDLGEISAFYRQRDGETPEQAFDRAADRWFDQEERRAMQVLDDEDLIPPESSLPRTSTDWRGNTVFHPGKDGFDFRPDPPPRPMEDIPFETGTKAESGASPRNGEGARAEGQGAAEGSRSTERPGAQDARGGGNDRGAFATDAGPDGGRQTVVPGAERIGDRQLAERRGQQPLRGGNEAPPKGGLFDEDARNQADMFDAPQKARTDEEIIQQARREFFEAAKRLTTRKYEKLKVGDRVASVQYGQVGIVKEVYNGGYTVNLEEGYKTSLPGDRWVKLSQQPKGDGPKFYSNPFFAPEVWSGLAKSLGVHADYFRDLKASFQNILASRKDTSGKKTNILADIARGYFHSTDGELRAVGKVYDSPTIKKIADMLFAPADMGRGGAVQRTYHEAVEQRTVSNLNKLADVLKDFRDKPDVLNQIRQLVQNPGNIRPGTKIHDAATAVRKLLDDEFKYLNASGVKIESNIAGYFPRIVNAEAVLRNPSAFVEAASKQYLKDRIAKNKTEADTLAQAWLASIELGHAGAKKDGTDFVMLGGTPNSDFRKERVFGNSLERDKNNPLAKFYMQDPIDALTLHFQRTARRAEWARRFGDDLSGWKDLKESIIKEGNVASLRQVVDAIAVATGTQRAYQTDAARTAIGALRTLGAISLLPRATITSLSEVAMPAIRSGNLGRVLGDIVNTTRSLAGGMKAEREIAADLGLISNAIGDSVLGRRYFALEPGSKVQQDIINRYFRRTGLEQLTNSQRVVAVAAGQTFLRRLAKDVAGDGARSRSSTAFLRELGIQDAKGFSDWLGKINDGMPSLGDIRADEGFSGQYRTALQRFNQQASLNPNNSTRPRWASHPLGSLAFMLQSYAYAFQKQVLNRAAGGAVLDALNPKSDYGLADRATMLAPAMGLSLLFAIQWGLQDPRDAVFGDPTAKPKTPEDKFMQVLSRSGLTGIADPWINMATGARYGRDAATALAGPIGGKLAGLVDSGLKLGANNSDNTNTAERNFAKAFYDVTLMPAAAVASGFLPAPIGAVAIQAASSGTAKEAFAESTAGPKRNPLMPQPPRPPRPPRPPGSR